MKTVSEETKAKMRAAWTPERKAALSARRKGVPRSNEVKAKISAKLTGRKRPYMSPEWRAAIGRAHRGIPSPSKGKPKPPGFGARISAALKGRKKTEEHRAKLRGPRPKWVRERMSEGIRKRSDEEKRKHIENYRAALTPEIRAKISSTHKGKKRSEEFRQKIVAVRAKAKYPFNNSKPERAVCEWLTARTIVYQQHARLPFYKLHAYDIAIENVKTIIEIDGCYWHGCDVHYPNSRPKQTERDKLHTEVAIRNGWKVLRIWEHEINAGDFSKLAGLEVQDGQSHIAGQPELASL